VQSLVACAREGLVRVDVTAGDGTKVKVNASMAANATAEQLGLDIAGLEKLLAAEVEARIGQALAGDAAEDALFGGDEVRPPAGGVGRKRTAGKPARRKAAAQAKLEGRGPDPGEQAGAGRAGKIAKLAAERDRLAARATEELAKGQARVDRHAARAAAAAGAGRRQSGRAPWPAGQQRDVRASAQAAARAARKLDQAIAAPAVTAPDRPPKANTTDLASRVMPLKKGGFDQLYNLQALAGRRQVILAVATHDGTNDVGALPPLLAAGAANLAAAGLAETIGTALFDAGYASDANFAAACGPDLYVAVTRESAQTGKSAADLDPAASTAPRTGAARTCSCGYCRTISPGTCRPGSRRCCSPTTTSKLPPPPGPARSPPQPAPPAPWPRPPRSRPPATSQCTASPPCSLTSARSA
jgi:hypothetical protein